MQKVIIRKAKQSDINKVTEFGSQIMHYHYNLDPYYKPSKNVKQTYVKFFKKVVIEKKTLFLVAVIDNKLVGYALANNHNRIPLFAVRKIGLITDAFVLPKYRKLGIGKLFFERIIDWFKKSKIKHIELTVHNKNVIGKNAWKKYGFKTYMLKQRVVLK